MDSTWVDIVNYSSPASLRGKQSKRNKNSTWRSKSIQKLEGTGKSSVDFSYVLDLLCQLTTVDKAWNFQHVEHVFNTNEKFTQKINFETCVEIDVHFTLNLFNINNAE